MRIKKIAGWMIGIVLLGATLAEAATYTWSGADGANWSVAGNWTTGDGSTFPGSGDTAIIADMGAARTIIYDTGAGSTIGTLTFNTSSYTNKLRVIRTGLTISSDTTLGNGAYLWLDPSQNQTSAAGSTITLTISGSTNTLTIASGGTLDMGGYRYSTSMYVSKVVGNVLVSGGTLLVSEPIVGASNTASTSQIITGTLEMSSGYIKIDKTNGGRLTVNGNFTMSGGTLTSSDDANGSGLINLSGAVNNITGGTVKDYVSIYLTGTTGQTFSTSVYVKNLMARSPYDSTGNWTTGNSMKTISSSYDVGGTGSQITALTVSGAKETYWTGIKLGSDLRVGNLSYANGVSGKTVGSVLDLNGHVLSILTSTTATWTPANPTYNTTGIVNWYLTNTGSGGEIKAGAFNFSTAGEVNVGYGAGADASTRDSGSSSPVVLHATGASGTNDLGGGGLINPTARFWYTGNNASSGSSTLTVTGNRTVGKVEVGDGSVKSVLKLVTTSLTVAGDVKVNSASFFDLNGQILNMTGSASLSGNGTIQSSTGGSSIVFASGATGGFSPGGTANSDGSSVGNVGTLSITAANISGITLASTSVSNFDFYSASSYDKVDLNGVSVTLNGQLALNFINGYMPTLGATFDILTNNDTGVTGSFSSITSNLSSLGYTFTVDSSGLITVTAIPEPSTVVLVVLGSFALLTLLLRKRIFQKLHSS